MEFLKKLASDAARSEYIIGWMGPRAAAYRRRRIDAHSISGNPAVAPEPCASGSRELAPRRRDSVNQRMPTRLFFLAALVLVSRGTVARAQSPDTLRAAGLTHAVEIIRDH